MDELSPYELYQLQRWGTIFNNADLDDEPESESLFPHQDEIIFEQLNPE